MYQLLKLVLKKIIPPGFLKKHEGTFRKLIYPFYSGKNYTCNVCTKRLRKFIKLSSFDLLCPYCGSRSRSRRLYSLLLNYKFKDARILHFSPPKALNDQLKRDNFIQYSSTDYSKEFVADYELDITNINCSDDSFDVIICYHILEHIEDDLKAMNELFRILKPNGICLIQTPYKEGEIYEDLNITKAYQREKAFGQKDHVRIYSINGLDKRLTSCGFKTEILSFTEKSDHHYGWLSEKIIVAKR